MRYLTVLVLLFAVTGLHAETRYVSDHLVITLRAGQGNAYKVLRTLHSGARLEVLEEDGEFVRVRTDRGTEGWVRGQYLVNEPVAKDQLADARSRLEQLTAETEVLRRQVTELKSRHSELSNRLAQTEKAKEALEEEVAELKQVAAMPIRLREENRTMRAQIGTLESRLAEVGRVNAALRSDSQRDWFLTGAGVLGSGIFLGLVLPLIRRRRRSSAWGDLR